jgi:hypothetical protein
MSPTWNSRRTAAALSAVLCAVLCACSDSGGGQDGGANGDSIESAHLLVRQNQTPTRGCKVTTNITAKNVRGTLDISMGIGYVLYPLLESNAPSSLILKNIEVKLLLGNLPGSYPSNLTEFVQPLSGVVEAGRSRAINLKVIRDALVAQINFAKGEKYEAHMDLSAVGVVSGELVVSPTFRYTMDICNGCLVDLRSPCPPASDGTIKRNACGLPQDSPVTCCFQGKQPTCFKTQ